MNIRYQRKYYFHINIGWHFWEERRRGRACEVQTLLNETKANVCASIVEGKSFLARSKGSAMAERKS